MEGHQGKILELLLRKSFHVGCLYSRPEGKSTTLMRPAMDLAWKELEMHQKSLDIF